MAFSFFPNITTALTGVTQGVAYQVITTFISAWGAGAVRASGDGSAAYSSSGNVFTQGVAAQPTALSIGNTNAWFVVAPPDNSYYLCFQRQALSGHAFGCAFSLNPFTTGGNATTRPTSTGEIVIRTPASPSSFILGGTSVSFTGCVMHGIFGGADEEYAFALINLYGGHAWSATPTLTTGGMFVDVCRSSFLNVDQPSRHIVCPYITGASFFESGGTGTIFNALGDVSTPNGSDRPVCWLRDTSEPMVSCGLINPTGSTENTFDYRFGWDGTRRVQMYTPVWVTKESLTGKGIPLIKGESRLFKVTTAPAFNTTEARGGPQAFTSDRLYWMLGLRGAVATHWDGATDGVIAG